MKKSILVLVFLTSVDGFAHPVSFQDSVGVMGHHNPRMSHFQLNYSWKYWFATGYHHFSVRPQGSLKTANFLSTNFLLKRWNGEDFQANIYAAVGAGTSDISEESKAAGLGLLQFDIEDRKYYFLAKYMQTQSEDEAEIKQATVRAGVAPYVGSFTDIHSWLIIEFQQNDVLGGEVDNDITPYLRVFYRNVLFEIGHSFDGDMRFNYIAHF